MSLFGKKRDPLDRIADASELVSASLEAIARELCEIKRKMNPGGGGGAALGRIEGIVTSIAQQEAASTEREIQIMAFGAEVVAFIGRVQPIVDAAVADIQKIHTILAAGTDADIPAAQAALAELEARFAALKTEVDRPEPGDPPAPPVE